MSDLSALQKRAKEIADRYADLNKRQGNSVWGPKDHMMGFVTDIGELNELVYDIDLEQEFMTTMDELEKRTAA